MADGLQQKMFRIPGEPPQKDSPESVFIGSEPGAVLDLSAPGKSIDQVLAFTETNNVYLGLRGKKNLVVNIGQLAAGKPLDQAIMKPLEPDFPSIVLGQPWAIPLNSELSRRTHLLHEHRTSPIAFIMARQIPKIQISNVNLSDWPVSPFFVAGGIHDIARKHLLNRRLEIAEVKQIAQQALNGLDIYRPNR